MILYDKTINMMTLKGPEKNDRRIRSKKESDRMGL